jgi:hypothetical protein
MQISERALERLIKEDIDRAIEKRPLNRVKVTTAGMKSMPGAQGGGERGVAGSGDDIMSATR